LFFKRLRASNTREYWHAYSYLSWMSPIIFISESSTLFLHVASFSVGKQIDRMRHLDNNERLAGYGADGGNRMSKKAVNDAPFTLEEVQPYRGGI